MEILIIADVHGAQLKYLFLEGKYSDRKTEYNKKVDEF